MEQRYTDVTDSINPIMATRSVVNAPFRTGETAKVFESHLLLSQASFNYNCRALLVSHLTQNDEQCLSLLTLATQP